jgi:hypothetical protein
MKFILLLLVFTFSLHAQQTRHFVVPDERQFPKPIANNTPLPISVAPTEDEKALCGDRPKTLGEAAQKEYQGRMIERLMPPVSNQNPASWCFAFNSSDLVNYHNFIQHNLKVASLSSEDFYLHQNMISPFEAVHAKNYYQDNNTTPRPNPFCRMDLRIGGNTSYVLGGLQQRNYETRSMEQLHFDSIGDNSPRTQARVQALIDEYKARNPNTSMATFYWISGLKCPVPLFQDPEFKKQIQGFQQVSEYLYEEGIRQRLLANDFVIDGYEQVSEMLGPKDLKVHPFINVEYKGTVKAEFLNHLKKALFPSDRNGSPVSVSVCAEDMESASGPSSSGRCGNHAVNVVGAYYEEGKCVVRLRNTWGAGWGDKGHSTLPVDKFIKAVERYNSSNSLQKKYAMIWMEPETNDPPPKAPRSKIIEDGNRGIIGNLRRDFIGGGQSFYYRWSDQQRFGPTP